MQMAECLQNAEPQTMLLCFRAQAGECFRLKLPREPENQPDKPSLANHDARKMEISVSHASAEDVAVLQAAGVQERSFSIIPGVGWDAPDSGPIS